MGHVDPALGNCDSLNFVGLPSLCQSEALGADDRVDHDLGCGGTVRGSIQVRPYGMAQSANLYGRTPVAYRIWPAMV